MLRQRTTMLSNLSRKLTILPRPTRQLLCCVPERCLIPTCFIQAARLASSGSAALYLYFGNEPPSSGSAALYLYFGNEPPLCRVQAANCSTRERFLDERYLVMMAPSAASAEMDTHNSLSQNGYGISVSVFISHKI